MARTLITWDFNYPDTENNENSGVIKKQPNNNNKINKKPNKNQKNPQTHQNKQTKPQKNKPPKNENNPQKTTDNQTKKLTNTFYPQTIKYEYSSMIFLTGDCSVDWL